MKFLNILSLITLFGFSQLNAQDVKVIKYEELFDMVKQPTDQLIAVNFWATWCGPCVEEMPHFVEVSEQYKDNSNFKILFVSMDRAKQLDKVQKFIVDYNINAEVVLLDDNKRMKEWIPAIDSSWSGNIPVTVFYQNGEKVHFVGQDMSKSELEQNIKTFIK